MEWKEVLTIIGSVFTMFIWFWSRIDRKFDKMESRFDKIENRMDRMENRMDRMENSTNSEFKELRTSLNRMEGAFYSKDCCMLKDEKQDRKAE